MLTIKQLEAFYWLARLGTLSKAAEKLHVTQSAVTKRLQEVQAAATQPLFEGEGRKNQLTPLGRELEIECGKLLDQVQALDRQKTAGTLPVRILRVGLTEVIALTWFPDFLRRMKQIYPGVIVQPEIDMSAVLQERVEEGRLDFSILPDVSDSATLVKVSIGTVPFGWFAAPGIFPPGAVRSLQDLSTQPVIEQAENSIITVACSKLWERAGVRPERIYGGNNVLALAGLISAGVGISCLPIPLFKSEIKSGSLVLIKTSTPAPTVSYSCCFLKHPNASLGYQIAEVAKECSTFVQAARRTRPAPKASKSPLAKRH